MIDTESRTADPTAQRYPLTLKEYEMLLLFVSNPGVALYRETIYERVWDERYYGDTRTVDCIQRKKLNLSDEIQSVPRSAIDLRRMTYETCLEKYPLRPTASSW